MFPGYKASPYFDRVRKQKGYSQFLRILQESRHQRPVMPAQAYFMTSLGRALEFAVYGRKSPREALDDSTVETQTELDMQLGGRKTR